MNPYEAPATTPAQEHLRRRWVLSFLFLNAALVGIPAILFLTDYVLLRVELAMQTDSLAGGPVTYHTELVGVSGPIWPVFVYLLLPNAVLLLYLMGQYGFRRS